MDDRRLVFDADVGDYVDSKSHRPPICTHSSACLSSGGGLNAGRSYYTLPISCITNNCKIDKWNLENDTSHLQLQCGASLQPVLNDMLRDGNINIHQYYQVLEAFKNAVQENMCHIKDLHFSHTRNPTVKISGKINNYKNENNEWVFFLNAVHISMGKLAMTSSAIKIKMTKQSLMHNVH